MTSGIDYRDASLSNFYLNFTGTIMSNRNDNSNMPELKLIAIQFGLTYGSTLNVENLPKLFNLNLIPFDLCHIIWILWNFFKKVNVKFLS